jgi:hypothetical protein
MTHAPDVAKFVVSELSRIASTQTISDGIRVTTHCMYPSNGLVQVVVRGGAETIVASDDGAAFGEAAAAGISIGGHHTRFMANMIRDQGLLIKDGVIFTPKLPIDVAVVGVLHVANASQEIARWFFDHSKIKRTRDFRTLLSEFLQKSFDDRVRPEMIVGHSNKPHKFANVVLLQGGRKLIVDPVAHEASSINARVVANLDVKANNDPLLDQRIVYDDEESWTAADLNLLQVGAHVIPFSRSAEVIKRLAIA